MESNIVLESSINTLLRQNNGFAFGLSSKITGDRIVNLSMSSAYKYDESISGSWPSKDYNWYNIFRSGSIKTNFTHFIFRFTDSTIWIWVLFPN
ncbi:ANL_collapsed_G0027850.mRNA.1.CDS.1 [Saccharomyces cerevisiae]|nr:ANL_collapsed_G0027850.mRNA.1.CDS.1 [Saccharomyces cerevisiae]